MRISLFLICCFLFNTALAQTTPLPAREALRRVLDKNAWYPKELIIKKVSSVFSLKITFSDDGKVAQVLPSKYFPEKMKAQLIRKELFEGIHWEEIFKRKINARDALVIPFVAYDSMENNATFYEYTMEDLFLYPGSAEEFVPCVIMQTYLIAYQQGIP
ncbi:hypothetical protein [Chitinophaga arvensicola]|uniref:TonB protein C-terminal n=1 Tax=Chitinophaga arvensicola TaxID=29529 RepID=A0A1I0SDG0_9BACT|nr:hypothetical protein [Chitinophaga arvensicola]SEW56194.1 hypothetical protein SAMN04488122_6588 [Chitinophaga arvensicola]